MMLPLLDALARYLDDQGVGVYDPTGAAMAADWSIFPGGLPQTPDQAIALSTYAVTAADAGEPWTTVRVQARIRGTADYRVGADKAAEVFGALVGFGPAAMHGGLWVQLIIAVAGSGPVDIGPDVAGRHETVVNVEVEYADPTPHRP